jgi:hypothetical protein
LNTLKHSLSRRGLFILIVILASVLLVIDLMTPPPLTPGQKQLIDVENIETLRTRFNRDAGKTRLVILMSPT